MIPAGLSAAMRRGAQFDAAREAARITPEKVAASLPPLTDEQCARIAGLLSLATHDREVAR